MKMASRFVLNALMLTGGLSATFPNPAAAIPPVSVSVAPAAIAWDTNTWVDVTVSNLTVGSKLTLSLFVDLNRNGALDAADRRLLCLPLQDGVTNAIGSRVIPDDDDAAANGILRTRLSYHAAPGGGASVIWKSVGTYFWKAESSAGSASGRFDVTQRVGNVWFAGRVVDYVTDAAIPGALVGLEAIAEHLALPASWSDTNGNFMLNVPAGFATQKVIAAWAAGVNGITSDRGPNDEPFSSQILTGLAAGTNTLADPLYVLSDASIPGETFRVSGRVCDQNSNAVACAWINAEMRDEDADVWTVGLTDTNGNFSIPVVSNAEIGVEAMGDVVGLQGLMSGIAVLTVTSDVSGVAIYCPRATMLARVKVEAAAGGAPVVGADVSVGNDDAHGASYTLPDGTADVGVIPGSWYSALDEDSVRPLSYIPPDFLGPFTMSPPGPFTNIAFKIEKGYTISGHVFNQATNALAANVDGGVVTAFRHRSWDWWVQDSMVGLSGYYEIFAPTGTFRVRTYDFDMQGYLDLSFTNYYAWEQYDNGDPAGDPVVVGTQNVTGVNFHLPPGALIEGHVYTDTGTPIANAQVRVHIQPEPYRWRTVGAASTDAGGAYWVLVPPGSNYYVWANADGYLGQAYKDHSIFEDNSDRVTTTVAMAATNIDFHLDPASRIRGHISSGGTPIPGMGVFVDWMPNTNEWWATSRMGWAMSDSNGNYSIDVPPGTNYVVGTDPRGGSFYPVRYWNDVAGAREATHVGVGPGGVLNGIDLDLAMGFRVEGRVTDENGAPMGNVDVAAHLLDGEGYWVWSGGMWTEQDGLFGFPLPTGTNYFLVARTTWDGSWYPRMFYDGKLTREIADWVATNAGEVVSGVDFQLFPGYRVEGHVYRSDGHTPIQDAYVASVDGDGNWSDNTSTDPAGAFGLAVATNRQLRLLAGGYELASEFFRDVYELDQATVLQLPPLVSTNLDFVLYNMNEDGDGDGVPDRDEDSRPDGRYNPAEDWACFTNRDTDGEGLDDGREWSLGTDPQKRDSDDDTQSDMEEVDVLGTDPLNSTSKLECRQVAGRSNLTTVTWSSVPGKTNYWVQRSMNLKLGPAGWSPVSGPLSAAPGTDVTSAVVTNAPTTTNAAFRVVVPY